MVLVSLATPLVSPRIFDRWFSLPNFIGLMPIPLMTTLLFAGLWIFLARMPRADHSLDLVPFAGASSLFVLGFIGLAYSFYPYIVPERLTIHQASSAPESLAVILIGAVFVLPSSAPTRPSAITSSAARRRSCATTDRWTGRRPGPGRAGSGHGPWTAPEAEIAPSPVS